MQQIPDQNDYSRPMMLFWRCLGLCFVGVGFAGAFLPVLPTTPFMVLALWAFAKGSPRLHAWLLTHPRFGPSLQDWTHHGVIPQRVKVTAVTVMAISLTATVLLGPPPTAVLAAMIALMVVGAIFILTRPSAPPIE